MKMSFSDDVGKLVALQPVLRLKPDVANFSHVCKLFQLSEKELADEWRILRCLQGDLSSPENLMMLCTKSEKFTLFPSQPSCM